MSQRKKQVRQKFRDAVFARGEPVPPGFSPAELHALIGSSEEEAQAASERLAG